MYEEVSAAKVKEYRDAFDMFDRDRDGSITTKELSNVMKNLIRDISDAEIKQIIQEVDIDGNGIIDFEEFVVMMNRRNRESDAEEEVINAFRVFDTDSDGIISSSELRHVMTTLGDKLTDEEVDEMIREADIDNNGLIYYEEFVRMMMTK
jgi:calmodulin